jgi:hypothetical protein
VSIRTVVSWHALRCTLSERVHVGRSVRDIAEEGYLVNRKNYVNLRGGPYFCDCLSDGIANERHFGKIGAQLLLACRCLCVCMTRSAVRGVSLATNLASDGNLRGDWAVQPGFAQNENAPSLDRLASGVNSNLRVHSLFVSPLVSHKYLRSTTIADLPVSYKRRQYVRA